eukprot:7861205-Prorocentrum_lima.AAC.1
MHAGRCQVTRTMLLGRRAGQGRSLGFLWAWLSAADQFATAAEHAVREDLRISYQARTDARASLSQ